MLVLSEPMLAAVLEDQTLMRDYLGHLLERELGAARVVAIGSMAELRRREPELRDVQLVLFDLDRGASGWKPRVRLVYIDGRAHPGRE